MEIDAAAVPLVLVDGGARIEQVTAGIASGVALAAGGGYVSVLT